MLSQTKEIPCPDCHRECGWCSWYMKNARHSEMVSKEPCKCIRCSFCGGSGRYRDDDIWSEDGPCEECGGSGIVEPCGRCQYLEELDMEP